jgi:arsenate reductase-like glutaredoxin family protein
MKSLSNQLYIYSVDTSAFYTEDEQAKQQELREYKKSLDENKIKQIKEQVDQLKAEMKQIKDTELKKAKRDEIKQLNKEKVLKDQLKQKLILNDKQRQLNPSHLNEKNVIALFESTLSRTLGIAKDSISTNIIVVQVYYYEVLNDLIHKGFTYQNEDYIFFTASAGQIRTKKAIFVKKSVWDKHQETLMCGLTIEGINAKGGMNINKLLAYLALNNSSTVEWRDFSRKYIDKCIVVDDFETNVRGWVDYIDNKTFEIDPREMDVPINHMDGCGIMLPSVSKKAFMVRLPWVKGLLVPIDYRKWVDVNKDKGASTKVTDIYGKTWDIIEDDIRIIFTKSQFKMSGYYSDWMDYRNKFKENDCQAGKCNEEEDTFTDAAIAYQMLQTLTITDEELEDIASLTNDDIRLIGSDKETILKRLGATKPENKKSYLQKALTIYPELLNDSYTKKMISDTKKSMVKEAKAGKLRLEGSKYTFIIPDLVAFSERLFCGIEQPKGLLADEEVFCNLYENGQRLNVLRSPHLFKEHCLETNVTDEEKKKWFITNGIYTSTHSLISKVLQFDNDGDKALVVSNSKFVEVAERNMKGVLPLYYEMGVAKKEIVNADSIYTSLTSAFKANIGEVSNKITKVFNSGDKEPNLDVVKWLCMENNFVIDYAKTLYKLEMPKDKKEIVKSYTNVKLPTFFVYAKDKKIEQVESLNKSTVNRLEDIIINKRINFKSVSGKFNYKLLMKNNRVKVEDDKAKEIVELYDKLNSTKKWIMKEAKNQDKDIKYDYVWKHIRDELLKANIDVQYVVDVLVRQLYAVKDSENKETLWKCFGDVIYSNIEKNIKGTIQCEGCHVRVKKTNNRQKCCAKCADKREKSNAKERKERFKESHSA